MSIHISKKDIPVIENKQCECGHGAARHSSIRAGQERGGPGKFGYLCLISDCPCYNMRLDRKLI